MKTSTLLPSVSVAGGAAAFVLHLLQKRTGFEAATGLPVPGHFAGYALAACFAALAAVLLLLTLRLPRDSGEGPGFPSGFKTANAALLVLPVVGLLLLVLSGLADLYESLTSQNLLFQLKTAAGSFAAPEEAAGFAGKTQLLLGLLTLLGAAALLPAALACRDPESGEAQPFNGTLLLGLPVVLVVRLVLTYRMDSVDPSLAAYYVELLALVFLTLVFYRLSSFAFSAGRTRRFALYASLAVVFSLSAMADGGPHISSLLLYAGGAVTALGFLLLRIFGESSAFPHA